jgi:hypothetical protein
LKRKLRTDMTSIRTRRLAGMTAVHRHFASGGFVSGLDDLLA